jgi:hypothetical protein
MPRRKPDPDGAVWSSERPPYCTLTRGDSVQLSCTNVRSAAR